MSIIGAAIATFGGGGIFYVGAGAVQEGSNPTVPVPSGYQAGDVLVICGGAKAQVDLPAGWSTGIRDSTGTVRLFALYKVATSSESSVALTGVGGGDTKAVMLCYRGAHGTPIGTIGTIATGTSTSPATSSITTTVAYEFVLSMYTSNNTIATWTAPASTTERINSAATGSYMGLLVVDELKFSAGATTARTATLSASIDWDAIAISFKPA